MELGYGEVDGFMCVLLVCMFGYWYEFVEVSMVCYEVLSCGGEMLCLILYVCMFEWLKWLYFFYFYLLLILCEIYVVVCCELLVWLF